MKTVTALALLLIASPAPAVERFQSFDMIQNTAANSWQAHCTVQASKINPNIAYWGTVKIEYQDPNGFEQLLDLQYFVRPGARTFSRSSPGLYSLLAKVRTDGVVVVNFKATRYGPMFLDDEVDRGILGESGTFSCSGTIIEGAGPFGEQEDSDYWDYVHSFGGSERIYFRH